ncbi:hypothetical protein GS610_06740 [Ruegeria sp. HKCCD6228]|uniref:hypothetical protein n=1 Tax=Ruegeria sp. HKCCD6228 TaxID=2683001 RepID=UPI0014912B32|nr:hypothetical protein [Ruegeria sp. HKCCD6228]NOD96903.1 hypothetical protein [Ruegeria sp. HKCCD6228]
MMKKHQKSVPTYAKFIVDSVELRNKATDILKNIYKERGLDIPNANTAAQMKSDVINLVALGMCWNEAAQQVASLSELLI